MRQRRPAGHVLLCLVWSLLGCICPVLVAGIAAQTRTERTTIPPQQQPPTKTAPAPQLPQRSPGKAVPLPLQVQIRNFEVNPTTIQAEVEQVVNVSAAVTGTPRAVVLYRLDGPNPIAVTRLNDDGANGDITRRDGVYSADVRLKGKAGTIPLRLEVEPAGIVTAAARIVSQTVSLRVTAPPQRLPTVEITIIDVKPRQVQQGVATDVVVTAALSQGRWTIRSGQLLEQGSPQPLAPLQRAGTTTMLTARFVVQRSVIGPIPLIARVEVSPIAAAGGRVLRAESSVFPLQVIPAPTTTQVQDKGLVLTVPAEFMRVNTKGAAILLTNFPLESFNRGGFPPRGGCLIEATGTPRTAAGTRDLMATETDVQASQIQSLRVAGRPAFRAAYQEEFFPGRRLEYVAIYVESPKTVHKFFLSFLAGDAIADSCQRSLDSVLASARITE